MNKTVSISEESFKKLKLFKLHYKKVNKQNITYAEIIKRVLENVDGIRGN